MIIYKITTGQLYDGQIYILLPPRLCPVIKARHHCKIHINKIITSKFQNFSQNMILCMDRGGMYRFWMEQCREFIFDDFSWISAIEEGVSNKQIKQNKSFWILLINRGICSLIHNLTINQKFCYLPLQISFLGILVKGNMNTNDFLSEDKNGRQLVFSQAIGCLDVFYPLSFEGKEGAKHIEQSFQVLKSGTHTKNKPKRVESLLEDL